jgi:hypothetical protein
MSIFEFTGSARVIAKGACWSAIFGTSRSGVFINQSGDSSILAMSAANKEIQHSFKSSIAFLGGPALKTRKSKHFGFVRSD